jgi:hypothetical protein
VCVLWSLVEILYLEAFEKLEGGAAELEGWTAALVIPIAAPSIAVPELGRNCVTAYLVHSQRASNTTKMTSTMPSFERRGRPLDVVDFVTCSFVTCSFSFLTCG